MTADARDERIAAEIHAPVDASIAPEDAGWTLTMRRVFPQSPERLWSMLTDPDSLARWSPIVPDRPLTSPGPASARENPHDDAVDAEVLVADPPRLLVHRWGGDTMRWVITPHGQGSLLEMRHTFGDRSGAHRYAAGWRVCIGRLAADAQDPRLERVVGERAMAYDWQALADAYAGELDPPAATRR